MKQGYFYYICDEFYEALPNCGLMTNKPDDDSGEHGRPCHYCFEYMDFYWFVPISSNIFKYQRILNDKIQRRGFYDGIIFGYVNGKKRAFLLQNAFPCISAYVDKQYMIYNGTVPVTVNATLSKELNKRLRKIIRMHKKGIKTTLTDLPQIINFLNGRNFTSSNNR